MRAKPLSFRPDDPYHRRMSVRLRQLTEAKDLTQQRLAELSGVHVQTIYKLMHGRVKDPQMRTVIALAHVLGVTTDYLLGIDPKPERPT